MNVTILKNKILKGHDITKDEALTLVNAPLAELCVAADEIREHFCGKKFDVCTILNVKSGRCSEDCVFCAQSSHYNTQINEYPLISQEELKQRCLDLYHYGIKRVSFVVSGRTINDGEFESIISVIDELKNIGIHVCVSLGLLNNKQIQRLNEAGVTRIHCNLESSENYFSQVCTTHSFNDKTCTVKKINSNDVLVCSGGIFGLGESFEDRIDLAFCLRDLNAKSIPINVLNPIVGTPVGGNVVLGNDEVCRIVAIFRFVNPDAFIRMAGGRSLLCDHGLKTFRSGSNSAIFGNMLTTLGVSFDEDVKMVEDLGFEICYDL